MNNEPIEQVTVTYYWPGKEPLELDSEYPTTLGKAIQCFDPFQD